MSKILFLNTLEANTVRNKVLCGWNGTELSVKIDELWGLDQDTKSQALPNAFKHFGVSDMTGLCTAVLENPANFSELLNIIESANAEFHQDSLAFGDVLCVDTYTSTKPSGFDYWIGWVVPESDYECSVGGANPELVKQVVEQHNAWLYSMKDSFDLFLDRTELDQVFVEIRKFLESKNG